MFFWLIPKEFICGLICAGVVKSLNTSTYLGARLTYLSLTATLGGFCLLLKLFSQDVHIPFSNLLVDCSSSDCISQRLIRGLMASLSLFHLLVLCLASLFPSYSSSLYQRLWFLKLFLYLLVLCLTFLLSSLLDYFTYIALPCAFIFILIEGIYTVDIAYDWNDTWYDNYTNSESSVWAFLLILFTFISWTANCWLLYLSYSSEVFFYIFVYFFSCFILTVISSSSLCENGCILYVALLSSSLSVLAGFYFIVSSLVLRDGNKEICEVLDLALCCFVLLYVAFVFKEKDKDHKYRETCQTEIKNQKDLEESKIEETDQPEATHQGSFQLFQLLLICFSCYIGMVLTDWDPVQSKYLGKVAGVCQGISVALFYVWSLIAPLMFPDREFSRN